MHRYANPRRFTAIAEAALPWLAALALALLTAGLWQSLVAAPPDYQQGEAYRIMFVHVPAAWMAMGVYAGIAAMSFSALVWRHTLAEVMARASAPIGAMFTLIALVTGSLWGKPMWGTFWVWDARLTSVLILFFLYLGYIALYDAFDDPNRGARAASILALVGSVNLPIIKFSVDWWNTLHQPASVLRLDGPAIHPSMLWPLLLMFAGFLCYYLAVATLRLRAEQTARRIRNLRLSVESAPGVALGTETGGRA